METIQRRAYPGKRKGSKKQPPDPANIFRKRLRALQAENTLLSDIVLLIDALRADGPLPAPGSKGNKIVRRFYEQINLRIDDIYEQAWRMQNMIGNPLI